VIAAKPANTADAKRAPSSEVNQNPIMPLDQGLSAGVKDHGPAVEEIVKKYFADPVKVKEKEVELSEVNENRVAENLDVLKKRMDENYKKSMEDRAKQGINPDNVKVVLTVGEQQFRDFVNDIWPTEIATAEQKSRKPAAEKQ
jgi:hypothetical protein